MRTRSDKSGQPSGAVLSILFALGDKELHGYGIMKEVEERTGGRVSLLPSSMYATIKRMMLEGWIEEVPQAGAEGPGRPRRSYRITTRGRAMAAREADRLAALLEMAHANRMVSDKAASDAAS
jgi:DNA-binding PadR family transcriptional regulator